MVSLHNLFPTPIGFAKLGRPLNTFPVGVVEEEMDLTGLRLEA